MALTGMQLREQMISFLLQNLDVQEREISELQKKVTELQKKVENQKVENIGA
jgi:low affinity Fe/Cu permease